MIYKCDGYACDLQDNKYHELVAQGRSANDTLTLYGEVMNVGQYSRGLREDIAHPKTQERVAAAGRLTPSHDDLISSVVGRAELGGK
jgi:hypothetical protein